jgi:hypothetical protein
VCLSIRKRCHDQYRNISDEFAQKLISEILTRFSKVILVGFGSEKFADNKRIYYSNLQEFTSLIQHKNCKATINSGGTVFIPALLTKSKKCFILNTNKDKDLLDDNNNPILLGKCVRFADTEYIVIDDFDAKKICDLI